MAKKQEQETAADMLRQFDSLKQKHPDAMLLFRKGDFYEMYREDAVKAAAVLAITLTSRVLPGEKDPVKYTLFPYHALDVYLPKLIRSGQRVAICDPIETPRQKKEEKADQKAGEKSKVKEEIIPNNTDMAKKKKTNLISMDVLMQCVKEKFSTDAFHSMHIDKFYFIGNTMYLQLAVDYQYKIGAYQEISYDRNYVVVSLNKKTGKSITYEEELSSFLKNYGNGYNDGNQCGMHNWTVRTGMILDVTQNGTWIGEFVNEKGELFYYSYNKNTKVTKLYSSKKAKVRLMQQGLNDEAYV